MNASNHPASRFSPASGRRVVALLLSLGMLALASCTPPRVGFSPEPPPGYAKSLEGSGHVNPEDPGLPNGGE